MKFFKDLWSDVDEPRRDARPTLSGRRPRPSPIGRLEQLERRDVPAVITTLAQLQAMSLTGSHVLGADIDATGATFTPVGSGTPFSGTFDGNGYKITGLRINTTSAVYVGLFGYTSGATLSNVVLEDIDIDAGYGSDYGNLYVGGLVGYAHNTNISDSRVDGDLDASSYGGVYAGGLVGYGNGSAGKSITRSRAEVDVSAYADTNYSGYGGYGGSAGGLIGYAYDFDVDESSAAGNILAYGGDVQYAGGLIGYAGLSVSTGTQTLTVSESVAKGNVTAGDGSSYGEYGGAFAGGLIGYHDVRSYGTGSAVGRIEQSSAAGTVYSTDGYYYGGGYGGSYGGSYAGGLVGYSFAYKAGAGTDVDLIDVYALGNATASSTYSYAGGLVGTTAATATTTDFVRTYAVGVPSTYAGTNRGGLVGSSSGATYTDGFWNTQTSGTTDGVGNLAPDPAGVVGKTTNDMRRQATFATWDFDVNGLGAGNNGVWIMAGYPHLQMEHKHMKPGSKVIEDVFQLQMMALDLSEDYVLANDINATDTATWNWNGTFFEGFAPVGKPVGGTTAPQFLGTFDGQNHLITNLRINRPADDELGLFGYLAAGSVVADVGLQNVFVNGYGTASDNIGGLAGKSKGTITNSFVTGQVDGNDDVGGLVGETEGGVVEYSYADVTIPYHSNSDDVGGLVGDNDGGVIRKSYARGQIGAAARGGGLAGQSRNGGLIEDSYATTAVQGGYQVGGLVGVNTATVLNSYATGAVSGTSYVGGLVGYSYSPGTVTNSYATGAVTGTSYVGGLVGWDSGGTYSSAYWDVNTSGTADGVGNLAPDPVGVAGKTTTEMTSAATFAGWDFGGAWIMAGAPHLQMEHHFIPTVAGKKTVRNAVELQLVAVDLSLDYVLANNVDASATAGWNHNGASFEGFRPLGHDPVSSVADALQDVLGFDGTEFTGTLDGAGRTITGLYINRPDQDFVGLFGKVLDADLNAGNWQTHPAAIQNLTISEPRVAGRRFVGGLAGLSEAKVSGVTVTAAAFTEGATTAYVKSGGQVQDDTLLARSVGFNVGGLIGKSSDDFTSVIDNCVTRVLVTHQDGHDVLNMGGLAGQVNEFGFVLNSRAEGDVIARQLGVSYVFQTRQTNFNAHVGGLVGEHDGTARGTVVGGVQRYVEASGAVEGGSNVGGLIGELDGVVEYGRATGTNRVEGGRSVGGFAGKMENRKLEEPGVARRSHATRPVTGLLLPGLVAEHAGGFAGQIEGGRVERSHATGAVTTPLAFTNVGGFAGSIQDSVEATATDHDGAGTLLQPGHAWITESYATGNVSGGVEDIGGFGGDIGGHALVQRDFATGDLIMIDANGRDKVGGFAGRAKEFAVLEDCYATGDVDLGTGDDDSAGGFVGEMNGDVTGGPTIRRSYAIGNVTAGDSNAGGFVGRMQTGSPAIYDSFSTGNVNPGTRHAGFAGRIDNGSVTNGWWFNDTDLTGVGQGPTGGVSRATARADFFLATQAVYTRVGAPWDFANVWIVQTGTYPILRWQL
jgi:hypothetical protein